MERLRALAYARATSPRLIVSLLGLAVSAAVDTTELAGQHRTDLAVARWSRVRVMVSERPPGKVVGKFVGADSIAVHVIDSIPATFVAIPFGYLLTVGGTVVGGVAGLANRDSWRSVWPPRR